ncbi:MAG TPA: hypothetical protein DDW73_07660 [Rhizobium sp.]|nr:hypothetical protein [Rhizobium sp.]
MSFAVTCSAMDRYYCTADDGQLKLSAETGFKELPGWPLSHLRAVVVFKPGQGKTLTGTLMLGSSNVIQYWRDGQSMMIRTASKSGVGTTATNVDVVLDSKMSGKDINHFVGRYTVTVHPINDVDPLQAVTRDGAISCARF